MNKAYRLIKKLVALAVVLLLSINSFAAVVGDNDGAAFITKAEFDSMKSDFQSQIDKYNNSIDSKITGVIASYVEAVQNHTKPTLHLKAAKTSLGRNPYFMNSLTGNGSTSWTTALDVQKQKNYSTKYNLGDKLNTFTVTWYASGGSGSFNWLTFPNESSAAGTHTDLFHSTANGMCYAATITSYKDSLPFKVRASNWNSAWAWSNSGWDSYTNTGGSYGWTTTGVCYVAFVQSSFVSLKLTSMSPTDQRASATGTNTRSTWNLTHHEVAQTASTSRSGSGSCWQYRTTPWGTKILERYYSSWWPVQNVVLDYKTYRDYSGTTYTEGSVTANALKDAQTCTYTPTLTAAYGIQTQGTKYPTYDTTSLSGYCQQNITLNKSTTDTRLYEVAQWGKIPSTNIYAAVSEPTLTKTTTNLGSSYTNLASGTVTIEGVTHTVTGVTNNVYEIKGTPETIKLDTFEVNPYTGIAGETVYVGGGIPFAYTQTLNGTTTFKITFKTTNLSNSAVSAPVKWMLSTAQFKDGNYAKSSDKLSEGTITTNSSGVGTATVSLDNLAPHQMIWLNAYSTTNQRIVEVTDADVSITN